MKRTLCVLLSMLLLVCALSFPTFNAAQYANSYYGSDHSGAYLVSYSGKRASVTRYTSGYVSYDLQLEYSIYKACSFGGKVVFFCDDTANNQVIVYVYDIVKDILDSFAIYGRKLYEKTDVCCDSDAIYIESHNNSKEVKRFSYSGSPIGTQRFGDDITGMVNAYDAGVYVVSGDSLYHMVGNRCNAISGGSVDTPLFPADAEYVASAYGKVYSIYGDRIDSVFDVETDHCALSACVIGGILYYPCGFVINGYDVDTGEKVCYYRNGFDASMLYADGSSVVAVNRQSGSCFSIHRDEFTRIKSNDAQEDNGGSGSGGQNNSGGSGNSGSAGNARSSITSDVYRIDYGNFTISGISPASSISTFKSNISYDGYTLSLYRDGTLKKSGNVGTAMTAVFTDDDGGSYTFELSVIGDLTGEGNQNSRDMTILMDHLIGAADFNGVYTISADLSADNTVDIIDAVIMKRAI